MPELWPSDSPYDLILDVDDENGGGSNILGLRLARDGKPAYYPARNDPSDASERVEQFENQARGAGFSRASDESFGGISYGEFIDDTSAGVIIPAGEVTEMGLDPASAGGYVRDAFELGGHLYLLMDRSFVFRWPNKAGTTIENFQFLAASITSQYAVIFNGAAYVTTGPSGSGIFKFDGTIWASSGSGVQRLQMAKIYWTISDALATGGLAGTAGSGDWFLVGIDGDTKNFVICAGDPMTVGNWSAEYPVGDSTYPVARMVWSNRFVAVAKSDGLYTIDELGYTPNLTPWVEKSYHTDNGSAVEYWNGALWYATKLGLAWVPLTGERQDVPVFIQFGDGRSNETPIYGFPRSLGVGADRLWVGMYNGSTGYVMAVKMGRDGRPTWHGAFSKFPGEIPTFLREVVTSAGHRWLLIGTHDGTNPHVYIQSLPQSGQGLVDYKQGTTHRFSTAWQVNYPITNFKQWVKKTGRRGSIVAGLLGEGNSIALKTATDSDIDSGDYTVQGTAAESPRSTFAFTGDLTEGIDWAFRVDGTSQTTKPVALRAVELRATAHPETVQQFVARVRVAKGQSLKQGTIDDESSSKSTLARIRALIGSAPIGMIDPFGDYHPLVKVESATSPILAEDRATQQWYAEVQIVLTVLQSAYRYDEDAYYDQIGEYL